MKLDQVFERRCPLPVCAEEAYAWHARPGAFARLMPPWAPVECLVPPTSLDEGSEAVLRVALGPVKKRWVARHSKPEPGVFFEDVQVSGPFARWVHRHSFEPAEEGCVLVDHIDYRLPLGPLGALFGASTRGRTSKGRSHTDTGSWPGTSPATQHPEERTS